MPSRRFRIDTIYTRGVDASESCNHTARTVLVRLRTAHRNATRATLYGRIRRRVDGHHHLIYASRIGNAYCILWSMLSRNAIPSLAPTPRVQSKHARHSRNGAEVNDTKSAHYESVSFGTRVRMYTYVFFVVRYT